MIKAMQSCLATVIDQDRADPVSHSFVLAVVQPRRWSRQMGASKQKFRSSCANFCFTHSAVNMMFLKKSYIKQHMAGCICSLLPNADVLIVYPLTVVKSEAILWQNHQQ
jgi:hypothetical protein